MRTRRPVSLGRPVDRLGVARCTAEHDGINGDLCGFSAGGQADVADGLIVPGERRSLLGDADRDRLVAVLREHYAAGRMDTEELRRRVGIVLAAAYADEAAVALDDLPPVAMAPGPGSGPAGGAAAGPSRSRRRKRHAQVAEPQPGWVPTAERFRDPSSGTVMRVWTDPADGSRHYVPDDGPV